MINEMPMGQFISIRASEKSTKWRKKIINNHPINKQIEFFYPNIPIVHDHLNDKSILLDEEKLNFQMKSIETFYYRVKIPLITFFQYDFINKYIQNNYFYAITENTPIDIANTFAIYPNGYMLLSVDQDTYEVLGLDGYKMNFKNLNQKFKPKKNKKRKKNESCDTIPTSSRHIISINLLSKDLVRKQDKNIETKLYKRLINCFKEFPPVYVLLSCIDTNGIPKTIQFDFKDENGIHINIERSRIDPRCEITKLKNINIPLFQMDSKILNDKDKEYCFKNLIMDANEWLGVMACRLTDILEKNINKVISDMFFGPKCTLSSMDYTKNNVIEESYKHKSIVGEGTSFRWTGLLSEKHVEILLEKAYEILSCTNVPWCAIIVWGFQDIVSAWYSDKNDKKFYYHSYLINGNNSYTIIIFKNKEHWILQHTGPCDETV